MPHSACTISYRLAGVCRTCKRATWPAHIAPDLSVYCADCCMACRLDRGPLENPRAKASGRRAVRSARPGKGGDSGPPETGPFCAATAPARDLARRGRHQGQGRSMPPGRSSPAHAMPLGRATGAAIAPASGRKAPDTAPPVAGDSGAVSGPARGILRAGLPACRTQAGAADAAARACRPRGGHDLAAPDAAASQSVAPMPAAGRPRWARPNTQVCAAHFAAKTFLCRNVPATIS
jgi:hypothetical protein